MATPPLTVHSAAITTVSVEIKTLTVSGKQVTLSVFRQLQEQQLIRDDGTFAGQPWGVVNYHPDKCSTGPEHWHVVWQDGGELRRSAVTTSPLFHTFTGDEGDRFLTSCLHDFLLTGQTGYFRGKPPLEAIVNHYRGPGLDTTTHHGFTATLVPTDAALAAARTHLEVIKNRASWGDAEPPPPTSWRGQIEQRLDAQLLALAEEVAAFSATTDELYAAYAAAVDQERLRRERHTAARATIAELPQLFIAV